MVIWVLHFILRYKKKSFSRELGKYMPLNKYYIKFVYLRLILHYLSFHCVNIFTLDSWPIRAHLASQNDELCKNRRKAEHRGATMENNVFFEPRTT